MAGGTTEIDLDYAKFDDKSMESEEAHARVDGEWDESEAERLDIDASDAETSFKVAHKRSLGAAQMEVGPDSRTTKRKNHTTYATSDADTESDTGGNRLAPTTH